jgi:DNA-binding GntR family transcriptional regulator
VVCPFLGHAHQGIEPIAALIPCPSRDQISDVIREISSPPPLESITGRYRTLRELVSRSLRAAILSGAMTPGQTLRELDVAERLGVSKTPVREAFRELEREGLVLSSPHRGVVVVGGASSALAEILELRLVLEPFAARLAAERVQDDQLASLRLLLEDTRPKAPVGDVPAGHAGDAFHRKIYEICGNSRMQRLLLDALEYAGAAKMAGCGGAGGVEGHLAVGEAILRRDPVAAEARMREHVEHVLEHLRAHTGRPGAGPRAGGDNP